MDSVSVVLLEVKRSTIQGRIQKFKWNLRLDLFVIAYSAINMIVWPSVLAYWLYGAALIIFIGCTYLDFRGYKKVRGDLRELDATLEEQYTTG